MNFTSQQVQKYTRIALQYVAAYLITKGVIDPNATWLAPLTGLLVGLATLGWTIYGGRISARIDEFLALSGDPTIGNDIKNTIAQATSKMASDPSITQEAKIAITNAAAKLPETKEVISNLGMHSSTMANVVTK